MILTPWELVRKNKVEIMQILQEDGCILLALGNRGRKGGYHKPFAVVVRWPLPSNPFEVDGQNITIHTDKIVD